MTRKFVGRFTSLIVALAAGCNAWAGSVSPVTPQGGDTYSLTVKANSKFTRDTGKLKEEAMAVATEFCTKAGKQLKVVSVKEDRSNYLIGPFAQVVLTFKALSPGDPALIPTTDEHSKPAINADILTSELTKLDDLRKKGLLTDEEFLAAKRKLLDRL